METRRSSAGNEYVVGVADGDASPAALVAPLSAGPNFGTSSWGQSYGVATIFGTSAHPLTTNLLMQINGTTNLVGLTGNVTNGLIQQVYLQPGGGSQFTLLVLGAGPAGVSGTLNLMFQDLSYDAYWLTLVSASPTWHSLSYISSLPQIISMSWNTIVAIG